MGSCSCSPERAASPEAPQSVVIGLCTSLPAYELPWRPIEQESASPETGTSIANTTLSRCLWDGGSWLVIVPRSRRRLRGVGRSPRQGKCKGGSSIEYEDSVDGWDEGEKLAWLLCSLGFFCVPSPRLIRSQLLVGVASRPGIRSQLSLQWQRHWFCFWLWQWPTARSEASPMIREFDVWLVP